MAMEGEPVTRTWTPFNCKSMMDLTETRTSPMNLDLYMGAWPPSQAAVSQRKHSHSLRTDFVVVFVV